MELEFRDSRVGILSGKLAHDYLFFAHEGTAFAEGKHPGHGLLKCGGLAVAEIIDRRPHGDHGCFQSFSRARMQNKQTAKSRPSSEERLYKIDRCRKFFDFSREDIGLPDSRVHMRLRARPGERGEPDITLSFSPCKSSAAGRQGFRADLLNPRIETTL